MNVKTYGDVLQEECDKFDSVFLHCATAGIVEVVARALILEFVKRVEERAEGIANACKVDPRFDSSLDAAFCELSTELKEAK